MPGVSHQQMSFGSGLNAQTPPPLLADGEVASATNVDFSLERGAAAVRRGSIRRDTFTHQVSTLFRRYEVNPTTTTLYVGTADGVVLRGAIGSGSYSTILSGSVAAYITFGNYKDHTYIAAQGIYKKDDGTTTTDWIKQSPAAPVVVLATQTPVSLGNTFSEEVGLVGTGTTLPVSFTGTATATLDSVSQQVVVTFPTAITDFTTINSQPANIFGTAMIDLAFSNPGAVTNVSFDLSITDSSFTTFWRVMFDATDTTSGTFTGLNIASLINQAVGTDTSITSDQLAAVQAVLEESSLFDNNGFSSVSNQFETWTNPLIAFTLHGDYSGAANPWADIHAGRITVTSTDTKQVVQIRNPRVTGNETYPLTDTDIGYTWWSTWATLDADGFVIGESAPSPPTGTFICQNAQAHVSSTAVATGSHGITHWILYRQGGLTDDAYAVATNPLATTTLTDTKNDIQALIDNNVMLRDVYNAGDFPGDVSVMAPEAFYDRLFVADQNKARWSLPGKPDVFPRTSVAAVSHAGDEIQAFVVWAPSLILVNRDSVYEMVGSIFEGNNQDWTMYRTGARRGTKAPRCAIKTPYGIPLLDYDGISLYIPGRGVDDPLDWAMEKIGDMWRGGQTYDPAALKGNRVPAINLALLNQSSAAYADGKLYLAVPVGSSINTMIVLDLRAHQTFVYQYPFAIDALYWDWWLNSLYAGAHDGVADALMQLDTGNLDIVPSGTTFGIAWLVRTRAWSTPTDSVIENIGIEYVGTATAKAIYDGTGTQTLGTFTSANRTWSIPAGNGTIANNVTFEISGSASGNQNSLYGIGFDALQEPAKVKYYKTDYYLQNYDGDKLWDVMYADLAVQGTGTITAVTFVDNVAVMTNVYSGLAGRSIIQNSFPAETYGRIAYTTYTSLDPNTTFKFWNEYFESRNEPPKVNYFKSDVQSMDENICDAWDFEINPNGVVTSTCFVDGASVATSTVTGSTRQSYTATIPPETYGRTIWVTYNGTGLKHYKTWFHLRKEPNRWTTFNTERAVQQEEVIWDAVHADVDVLSGLSTLLGTVVIDGAAVSTFTVTGAGRQEYVATIPAETYGKVAYVIYSAGVNKFKHYQTWYDTRKEPNRYTSYVTPREPKEESIWDVVHAEIDPLGGSVTGTAFVDGAAVSTFTCAGNGRQVFVNAIPPETYGKVAYVSYAGVLGAKFKHYETWFDARRDADRVKTFVSNRQSGPERLWDEFSCDINPLGTAVTVVLNVDGVVVQTATFSSAGRQDFVVSLPNNTYGRTVWASYSTPGLFKYFSEHWAGKEEPSRVNNTQVILPPTPSEHYLRTWIAELNPLGTAVNGTLLVDGAVLATASFNGTIRETFTVGLDVSAAMAIQSGTAVEARYSSPAVFKHYETKVESDAKPFGKTTWAIAYQKIGGASQLDIARYWALDADAGAGTATLTSIWDVDGVAFCTNTFVVSTRTYIDRIPFPPGGRGRLFEQRILASAPVRIWRSIIDTERVGAKGVARTSVEGTPRSHPYSAFQFSS